MIGDASHAEAWGNLARAQANLRANKKLTTAFDLRKAELQTAAAIAAVKSDYDIATDPDKIFDQINKDWPAK